MIPKVIHLIWIGPNPCPYNGNIKTYELNNPGWTVKVWGNNDIMLRNQRIFDMMNSWPAKADVMRLEILYRHGGVYVDADSLCLKPIDTLVNGYTCIGMTGRRGGIQNAFLAATRKHPAYRELVKGLPERIEKLAVRKKKWSIHSVVGAHYVTEILRRYDDFYQIEQGKRYGSRELICSPEEASEKTYIIQLDKGYRGKHKKVILEATK